MMCVAVYSSVVGGETEAHQSFCPPHLQPPGNKQPWGGSSTTQAVELLSPSRWLSLIQVLTINKSLHCAYVGNSTRNGQKFIPTSWQRWISYEASSAAIIVKSIVISFHLFHYSDMALCNVWLIPKSKPLWNTLILKWSSASWQLQCLGYFSLVTRTKYQHSKWRKRRFIYLTLEISAHIHQAPRQGGMALGQHLKAAARAKRVKQASSHLYYIQATLLSSSGQV